ncbi:MAG: helix-turn-helix transcriptional regulator [Clostridia bacterium]|nr:helix-turn-helix transcriptional regulator [Clostridia bacterium]
MGKADTRNEAYIKIGERIRYYRLKAGLTQEAVSEYVGITQKHLSRIESGYHNSHFITIAAIAKAINVPIDVFAEDLDENVNAALINTIVAEMSNMNDSQLQMLKDNIETIKKYKFY